MILSSVSPSLAGGFFSGLFSDGESIFWIVFFVMVIIPCMIYCVSDYEPHDALGSVSSCTFWIICGLLVLVSPLSLLFYYLYKKLFCYLRHVISAKKQKNTIPVFPDHSSSHSLPMQLTSPDNPNRLSNNSPAYRVCLFMWKRTIIFCGLFSSKLSLSQCVFVCTAFFYSISKHIRNQALVDEIYTEFYNAAEPFVPDGNKAPFIQNIDSLYHKFRLELNASGIDPRSDDGETALWITTSKHAFPDSLPPDGAESAFKWNLRLVTGRALSTYGLRPAKEHYQLDSD